MRDTGTAITLAEYLPLRRDSFGALFFFDLIDAVETLAPPPTSTQTPSKGGVHSERPADMLMSKQR